MQSVANAAQFDLIKTIDENADVQDFSEDSDAEVEVIEFHSSIEHFD